DCRQFWATGSDHSRPAEICFVCRYRYVQSSVIHHNIEGELVVTKTSTYRDLLIPDTASKFDDDDDDIIPPKTSITAHEPAPSSSSSSPSPSQLAPSSIHHPSTPSIPKPPPLSIEPPDPSPFVPKPKRRGRGPAKVYEKSRASQRIEDQNKSPPKATESADSPDELKTSDKDSDDETDEVQVRSELEPELSEFTLISAYLATGDDPESYEDAVDSVDCDERKAAMEAEMDSIPGTFLGPGSYRLFLNRSPPKTLFRASP
ncbi:hypothetical protein BDM02DRAFT_398062, partial [Thelephora ganbajun]